MRMFLRSVNVILPIGQQVRASAFPTSMRSFILNLWELNFRMVSATPWMLHGGSTAATRLPSGRRESRMGFASEMSSPSRLAMFLTATSRDACVSVTPAQPEGVRLFSMKMRWSVDHDLADVWVQDQMLDRAKKRKDEFEIHSSEFLVLKLQEIVLIYVSVVWFQVAVHRWQRTHAIVSERDGLSVLEFRERLISNRKSRCWL